MDFLAPVRVSPPRGRQLLRGARVNDGQTLLPSKSGKLLPEFHRYGGAAYDPAEP